MPYVTLLVGNFMRTDTIKKIAVTTVFSIFIFVFLGLVATSSAMAHGGHEGMEGCPLMAGSSSLCGMTVEEHLSLWQRLYHVSLHVIDAVALIAFLASLVALSILLSRLEWRTALKRAKSSLYHTHAPPRLEAISILRQLSRGIISPKRD